MPQALSNFLVTWISFAGYPAGLFVGGYGGIVLHELGHAVGGALGGYRPREIHVGTGKHLLRFRALGIVWNLRPFPTCGFVVAYPPRERWSRLGALLFVAAGPAASGLLLWGLWHGLAFGAQGATWLFWQFFALTALLSVGGQLVFSLFLPARWNDAPPVGTPADGAQFWQILRAPAPSAVEYRALADRHHHWFEYHDALEAGDHDRALMLLRDPSLQAPSPHRVEQSFVLAVSGRRDAAIELCNTELAELSRIAEDPEALTAIGGHRAVERLRQAHLLNLAFCLAQSGDPAKGLEVLGYDPAASRPRVPNDVARRRTLGMVLLHAGHADRGVTLLESAWQGREDYLMQAIHFCYLGYGYALTGRPAEARRLLRKSRRLHPRCSQLPTYERLVAETLGRS